MLPTGILLKFADSLQCREEELKKTMMEMDAFKLDAIARELKKIEVNVTACKRQAQGLVTHAGTLSGTARESVHGFASTLNEALQTERAHIKEVIQECLSELLKAHIGSATELHPEIEAQ